MTIGKYETKKGTKWFFEVDLGKDSKGKRQRRKVRGFSSEKDANKAETKNKHEINLGSFIKPSKILFQDYLTGWIVQKRNITEQTSENYKSNIKNHINTSIGNIELGKLHQTDIQDLINDLYKKEQLLKRKKKSDIPPIIGLAPSTIKRIYNIIHTSLEDAVKLNIIPKNVAKNVPHKPEKIKAKEMILWDINTINYFLSEAKGKSRFYVSYFLAILTGCRQSEILGLRWRDVDIENKVISIRQTLSHNGKTLRPYTKSGSSTRKVNISPKTVVFLKEHQKFIEEEKAKSINYQDYDLVVCTSNGTPVLPRDIMKVWKKLVTNLGLPYITFHTLRHCHASILYKQGHGTKLISIKLGHSSTQITQDLYTHLLPNMIEQAAIGLDDILL